MKVRCFTELEKDEIILDYTSKRYTVTELAEGWDVSRRTINRVLEERGVPSPVPRLQGEAHQVMQILDRHCLSADTLEERLELCSLDMRSVQEFLNGCTKTELAGLFYNAAVAKLINVTSPINA
jgi:transposase-like protein